MSMRDDDKWGAFTAAGVFSALTLGIIIGFSYADTMQKRDAIRAGIAEWIPSDNGSPKFHWKKEKQ